MRSLRSPLRFPLLTLACTLLLASFEPTARAADKKDAPLPETMEIDELSLALNGTAMRKKYGFKVYLVGLYLTSKTSDAEQIMSQNKGHKRVHITMLRDVESKSFLSTTQENIEVNFSAAEKKRFETEIASFLGIFGKNGGLKKGRDIHIDYIPEKGTLVTVDGTEYELIPGDEFYHCLLRLWIGKPLQDSIRIGLLNEKD